MGRHQEVPGSLVLVSQPGRASEKGASSPGPHLCLERVGQGQEGPMLSSLCWSRKMKDSVRLVFSLIRQQTETGRRAETGGWVPYHRHQQGHGLCREDTGIWSRRMP